MQYYKLTADAVLSKSQLKEIVLKYLIDEEIITLVEESEDIVPVGGMTGKELLQLKKIEYQEREAQLRLKELDLREKELALQIQLKELEVKASKGATVTPEANPSFKHVKFVPAFREAEVDKYCPGARPKQRMNKTAGSETNQSVDSFNHKQAALYRRTISTI